MTKLTLLILFITITILFLILKIRSNKKNKINIIELRRKKLIEEYGYDPYSIVETMKFHGIPYNQKKNKEINTSKTAAYINRKNINNEYRYHYLYQGEDDPVHRPHCYIRDPYTGRRKRVYLDEDNYEDAD